MQNWNPLIYAANARFVADLGDKVLDLLDAKVGETILDLGCGDGVLTARISETGANVLGIDSSSEMVKAAEARGIRAVVADGEALEFAQEFDAVFSNAALHWMNDQGAVMLGVRRALRAGGRFVAEFGGAGNTKTVIDAIDRELGNRGFPGLLGNPWYFPDLSEYQTRLENWGFMVRHIQLINRPTPLPTGLANWLDIFAGSFLEVLPVDQRLSARDAIVEALRPEIRDEDGVWWADYVRIRFVADLPA